MSTIDDIATPMEMMMEDSKNTHQKEPENSPINVPDSPVLQGIMRLSKLMSPDNAPFPQGKEPNPLIPQHSPLESLVATHTESPQAHPHHKRNLSVTFVDNNPVTPSPRSSFHRNPDESPQRRIKSPRKPTVPLNVSLANRPTKAWLAKHGQLPGQKDAEIELNPTGKRARENHLLPSNNKRQKVCTIRFLDAINGWITESCLFLSPIPFAPFSF